MSDNKESKVTVFYEKVYTDDAGKHIPSLFAKNNYDDISVKSYWGNTVDGFFKYDCLHMFTAVGGDLRIVTAYPDGEGYRFNQFFLSCLDGKVIKVQKGIWFAINNPSSHASLIITKTGNTTDYECLDADIFDWYSKR